MMSSRLGLAMVAAAGLCVVSAPVRAQFPPVTDPNKDEVKCQTGTSKAVTKFIGSVTKCVQKCVATQRKAAAPAFPGCFTPFSDPATNSCVLDPLKGANAKGLASIVKSCTTDCPECFDPGVCSTGDPLVSAVQAQIAPLASIVWCTEAGGTVPATAVAKCEDGVAKALSKLIGARTKCYQKCFQNEFKGKIMPGTCTPPASDLPTVACLSDPLKGANAKAAAAIDKVCANVAGATPACFGTGLDSGAEWVALVVPPLDNGVPVVACGG